MSNSVNVYNSMGLNGGKFITTTAATTPDTNQLFGCLVAGPAGCVIAAITGQGGNISGYVGLTLPAGYTIYDTGISSVTLTSGTLHAYNK